MSSLSGVRLEAWEFQAIEELLKAPAINVDETSLRVDKKNHWIHVYSSGDITLKFLHRKRGKAAIEALNIRNMGARLFMTAGHLICHIITAVTDFAVRICCVN
jgi:hypothetical protein